MFTGILYLHIVLVTLFLLSLTIKTVIMLFDTAHNEQVREKTRVVEFVLGSLILITGAYLFFTRGVYDETWLNVKTVLVLIGIPLSIISLKNGYKVLAIISCLIFIYVYGVAETKSLKFNVNVSQSIELKA